MHKKTRSLISTIKSLYYSRIQFSKFHNPAPRRIEISKSIRVSCTCESRHAPLIIIIRRSSTKEGTRYFWRSLTADYSIHGSRRAIGSNYFQESLLAGLAVCENLNWEIWFGEWFNSVSNSFRSNESNRKFVTDLSSWNCFNH